MEPNYKPKMLRSIGAYLPKSFKFYDIKKDYVAPLFFVLALAVNFLSYHLFGSYNLDIDITKPEGFDRFKILSSHAILVFFITNVVINLVATGYMYAFIRELKGEGYTLGECLGATSRNSAKITLIYVIANLCIPAYALALRLQGIWSFILLAILLPVAAVFYVVYLILIFSSPYVQDKSMGFLDSLKSSAKLSKGHKIEIFSIILIVKFISLMLMFFAMSFVSSPDNTLVQIFVESFVGTIFSLVEVRIVSMMYFDLEYSSISGLDKA